MAEYAPEDFVKCPGCHRTKGVTFVMHPDGDASFECGVCGTFASGSALNESDRTYSK